MKGTFSLAIVLHILSLNIYLNSDQKFVGVTHFFVTCIEGPVLLGSWLKKERWKHMKVNQPSDDDRSGLTYRCTNTSLLFGSKVGESRMLIHLWHVSGSSKTSYLDTINLSARGHLAF